MAIASIIGRASSGEESTPKQTQKHQLQQIVTTSLSLDGLSRTNNEHNNVAKRILAPTNIIYPPTNSFTNQPTKSPTTSQQFKANQTEPVQLNWTIQSSVDFALKIH